MNDTDLTVTMHFEIMVVVHTSKKCSKKNNGAEILLEKSIEHGEILA